MHTHREPTADELLSALEGKALPDGSDSSLLSLGRALEGAAPAVEEPNPFFAARLKAQLANVPMSQPKVSVFALLLPMAGIVAVGAIFFFLPHGQETASPAAAPGIAREADSAKVAALGGELTLATGEVRMRASASDAWQTAAEGAQIAPGSEVDVPADGRAVITLDDGSAVRLNGKTTIAFTGIARTAVDIRETRGTVYYRVVKDPNRTFTVTTEEGTVTALGTAFAVARDAEKKTLDVNCIESKVKIALAKDGTKLEKELAAGKTLSYDGKKSPDAGSKESTIDPQKIAVVPFFAWNITEDAKEGAPLGIATDVKALAEASDSGDAEKVALLTIKEEPTVAVAPEPKPAPAPAVGITLSGALSGTTAKLSWKVNGVDVTDGFKVVWAKEPNPTYPGSSASYQGADVRSAAISLPAGYTIYFRVCAYHAGSCGTYSNQVKLVTAATQTNTGTGTITLQGIVSGTTANLKWSPSGVETPNGFKVVVGTAPDPVYPGNDYQYLSDPAVRSYAWQNLPASTALYFRVCAYTGSGCSTYSNGVQLTTGTAVVKTTGGYSLLTTEQQLAVSQTANGVQLSWNPCSAAGFLYYKVVRSETNADPYYPNDGYLAALSGRSTTGYTDTTAVSGHSYYYRICSKESDGTVWCGNVVRHTAP